MASIASLSRVFSAPAQPLSAVLIAIADPEASGVGQILAARNRKRKRAIAKVVCFSVSRSLFGNRTLLSQQMGEALGDFAIYSGSRAGVAQW